jgi:hypothetical protein
MAVINTGAGYEIDDFCENVAAEIRTCNAASVVNGGFNYAFGSTGQRIYSEPQEANKVGRAQPMIYVMADGMSGDIYDSSAKPVGSGGLFQYDGTLKATVIILARGTKVFNSKQMRDWASRLRRWLEQKGANGYCQKFACGDTVPVTYESAKAPEGLISWQIPVAGMRELQIQISF